MFLTFLLTVFTDLTTGVSVGLLLAFLLFIGKMSKSLRVRKVLPDPVDSYVKSDIVANGKNCPQISIFTVEALILRYHKGVRNVYRGIPAI